MRTDPVRDSIVLVMSYLIGQLNLTAFWTLTKAELVTFTEAKHMPRAFAEAVTREELDLLGCFNA